MIFVKKNSEVFTTYNDYLVLMLVVPHFTSKFLKTVSWVFLEKLACVSIGMRLYTYFSPSKKCRCNNFAFGKT